MLRTLAVVVLSLLAAPLFAADNQLSEAEITDGWILLFDGETTFGWTKGSEANWQVQEGTLTVSAGEMGLLATTTEFADFVLRVDYRTDPQTNSGVFLRTSPAPRNPMQDCYEVNLAPADNPYPTGSLVGRMKAAAIPPGDGWHTLEITAIGARIAVRVDGRLVLDYTDPVPLGRGRIGLQFNQGAAAFKNIKLRPLSLAPLWNGRDLTGWRSPPTSQSQVAVTREGYVHLTGGKGYLESERRFGDFVVQLECVVNGRELNSGLFFRCIPGEEMNGYESQIHNGFKDGDRTKPVDHGTGAIFRRVEARRVVANDGQWFTKTLVARGPHIAVWVNGYQVTDWTDTRAPDANPRKGLRVEPGTLQLQGHDPTTDFTFRDFRAAELPPRWKSE